MNEPTELLAHYTSAAVAMEYVIPSGQLRLSPYERMRDPVENKYVQPGIPMFPEGPAPSSAMCESVWAHVKEVRDGCRLLSLTRDATDPNIPGDTFGASWSRPRMWEQYGDLHRGVCLVFDRQRLENALRRAFPRTGTLYTGPVEYSRSGIADSAAEALRGVDVRGDEAAVLDAVASYIEDNYDAFFFLKHDDFESEREFRALVTARSDEYLFVDYDDAVQAVILGERFPGWQVAGVVELCGEHDIPVLQIGWERGRPSLQEPARR
jgi:hypothetical protein